MHPGYVATGNSLADRIERLIPSYPEIMGLKDPFGLFKIKDFNCDDLDPTIAQASWALAEAQRRYAETIG